MPWLNCRTPIQPAMAKMALERMKSKTSPMPPPPAEPPDAEEIKTFCSTQYDVTFPLFAKVDVNGQGRHPLYAWLTGLDTKPDGAGDVIWNFAKFLVDGEGQVVARFSPKTAATAEPLVEAVGRTLGN